MGIFDKAENEAEDMAQKDLNPTQQAGRLGSGQDMRAAQNMAQAQQDGYEQGQNQNW